MIRKVISKLQPVLYRGIKWYYAKPRTITKRGIKIHLLPSVFHPTFYLSTDVFLDFLLEQNISRKTILELGTGNGFISLYLAKKMECTVTSSDINPSAIKGLRKSATLNEVLLNIIHSDLFNDIPSQAFDYILVNPPFYPKAISGDDEYAFFCGENFEYFQAFNRQIIPYLEKGTVVYMILSDTAPVEKIIDLAKETIHFEEVYRQRRMKENLLIYKLSVNKSITKKGYSNL